jgi:hypothetical protein
LAGHYKGPKKLKASGKAASGNKKKKIKAASKPKSSPASKKQRCPTNKKPLIDGFAPMKKKPS